MRLWALFDRIPATEWSDFVTRPLHSANRGAGDPRSSPTGQSLLGRIFSFLTFLSLVHQLRMRLHYACKVSARPRRLHSIKNSCFCGYSDPTGRRVRQTSEQMILLLGYLVSLAATFVLSVAVLSVVLAATTANKAVLYHVHRSETVQLSKLEHKELRSKSRLVTAREPPKTKAPTS